ncbi:phospholipid/cholesterol/gamma-HCH transport system substrate-binding protein [Endobacter medicaginis]|uniref:MCE family protein n=1 Tax=Endobacter medicaginis TaxID=1181271 RepID=A0A839V372_9PROT|nr:MlaD family protein [Endobacter medicaginis]MBB3174980.1 phospholipid/cholesterol/gamma-HCH transport system substrate-binding protein [Endobacter medicaginis]MCX5475903.1 MlaD family protein [Endobacter medicaginis]NVN28831.1 MCE family protein [Endobacter medicaginis]
MTRHSKLATLASLLVLLVAAVFLNFLLVTRGSESGGYRLTADFTAADGISSGSNVVLAGLRVGRVASVTLDPKTLFSHVVMTLEPDIHLPVDSSIAVGSAGLTSGNQLVITPGTQAARLAPGAAITDTHDYRSLETQIGQYIFGAGP